MPELRPTVTQFVPTTDEPLSGADALQALQDILDPTQAPDLIVSQATPAPLGKAPAYDVAGRRFDRQPGSRGPSWTHGDGTLRSWVEKCLATARGAHPIHPPGYGLLRLDDVIGGPVTEPPADLASRITDALTFHPRVVTVKDFEFGVEDDAVAVGFTVVTDRDDELPVQSTVSF